MHFILPSLVSVMLLISPFSNPVYKDIEYPFTRTDTVTWYMGAFVEDLGELNAATPGGKHEYKITYEVSVNCNNVCILGSHGYSGYNLSSTTGTIFFNERVQKTPTEMQTYLDVTNTGTETARHTFNNSTADASITIKLPLASGTTLNRNINFPALSEGTVINSINNEAVAWHEHWLEWEAMDIEQKTREIEMWIWQLNTFRNMPAGTVNSIKQYLNNSDPDAAYQVLYDYMDNIIAGESASINNAQGNNNSARTNFNNTADQEINIASSQETQFSNAISQVDSTNPFLNLTDFSNSAQWVRDRFNEITHNNAFGSLLQFSLILGLALAIIGRIL